MMAAKRALLELELSRLAVSTLSSMIPSRRPQGSKGPPLPTSFPSSHACDRSHTIHIEIRNRKRTRKEARDHLEPGVLVFF